LGDKPLIRCNRTELRETYLDPNSWYRAN